MKKNILYILLILLLVGCSKEPYITLSSMPKTELIQSGFIDLPKWEDEDFQKEIILDLFFKFLLFLI